MKNKPNKKRAAAKSGSKNTSADAKVSFIEKLKALYRRIRPESGWLHSTRFLMILSLLVSIACWVLMTLYVNTDSEKVITDVPITIDTSAMQENFGLQMISVNSPAALADAKIDVTVRGTVYQINQVTRDDISIIAQTSSVNKADVYQLSLALSCSNKEVSVSMEGNYTTISVWFDRIQQKNITLDKPQASGVSTSAEDLVVGDIIGSIKTLTLRGPESVINSIASVHLSADVNKKLSETTEFPGAISYLDAEGQALPSTLTDYLDILDYNDIEQTAGTAAGAPVSTDITVTVPIRKVAELPIKLIFKNVPENFDTSTLKYSLSANKIKLEGDIDAMNQYISQGFFPLQEIDLQSLSPAKREYTLKLNLSSGVEALSSITEVTVTFNFGNYATKTVTVPANRFKLINSDGINASITSETIDITLVGPSSKLNAIDENDITVSVDMSDYDGTAGSRKMTAAVSVDNEKTCWAIGSYTVMVQTA